MKTFKKSLLTPLFAVSLLGMGLTACDNSKQEPTAVDEPTESATVETETKEAKSIDTDITDANSADMSQSDTDDASTIGDDQVLDGTEQEEHVSTY